MKNYHILDWDSEFFGFKVAQIIPSISSEQELKMILSQMRNDDIRLAYGSSLVADDTLKQPESFGGLLVDHKTTYVINFKNVNIPENQPPVPVVSYESTMPSNDMKALAIQSGNYSRFAVDPRITKEKFINMYVLWIEMSIKKELAREVLVIFEDNRIVGMITLGEKNERGEIGLFAVQEQYRGKGFGQALVTAAHRWFIEKGYAQGQVVTQKANVSACHLYEKCGYSVEKVETFYHFWL